MVLVRLLGSKPCFDAVRNLPELATVLFQVFLRLFINFDHILIDNAQTAPEITYDCFLE